MNTTTLDTYEAAYTLDQYFKANYSQEHQKPPILPRVANQLMIKWMEEELANLDNGYCNEL